MTDDGMSSLGEGVAPAMLYAVYKWSEAPSWGQAWCLLVCAHQRLHCRLAYDSTLLHAWMLIHGWHTHRFRVALNSMVPQQQGVCKAAKGRREVKPCCM